MSEIEAVLPTYALSAPMQIGAVSATTRALDLSGVVFDSPEAFEVGETLEFSILVFVGAAPLQMACRGIVTRCTAVSRTSFDVAATIDELEIAREHATPEGLV